VFPDLLWGGGLTRRLGFEAIEGVPGLPPVHVLKDPRVGRCGQDVSRRETIALRP